MNTPPTAINQEPPSALQRKDYYHQHKGMYDDPRWKHPTKGLRVCILRKHPVCVHCKQAAANTVDHIKDHNGDWKLFLDPKNLQALCASCHSKKTAETHGIGNRTPSLQERPGFGGLDKAGRVVDPLAELLKGK